MLPPTPQSSGACAALCSVLLIVVIDVANAVVPNAPADIDALYHTDQGASNEELDKRGSAFMPMRGRRDSSEEEKRAPAFFPLRGKKEMYEDKRASAFLPMRGRRDPQSEETMEQFDEDKRARAFMPMRGKKEEEKRASAFLPMRGRREEEEEQKRGSAFLPMRGKKEDEEKRAFHAMRGRNSYPFSEEEGRFDGRSFTEDLKRAFHALRGRRRLDAKSFKRAFHAMRGKKNYDSVDSYISSLRPEFVPEDDSIEEDKRASGFFGMRGKRDAYLDRLAWTDPQRAAQLSQ